MSRTTAFSWLSSRSRPSRRRSAAHPSRRANRRRLSLEALEPRVMLSVVPNDPGFANQWMLHNTGQTGGQYDADIDAPAAWGITTGSMTTVVAVIDDGVDYTAPDLYLNIWLNQGEIPAGMMASLTDADSDGLVTFRDLNSAANANFVTDLNGNGYIDGGDLLNDPRWENGVDEDANGHTDDLIGWDFHDNDNDPMPTPGIGGHGTGQSIRLGAIGNNGVGTTGVNWAVSMMAVRVQLDLTNRVNENAAAGLDYAVAEGAPISTNTRDNGYSQVMYDAISRARLANHLFVSAAGNFSQDMDANPWFPGAYDLDNIICPAATDAFDQLTSFSSWGLVNVDLGVSSNGSTSEALAHTAGVAALLKTLHPDWGYAQIKDRILATVDPVPALVGKTVTGGRLNAAAALATTSISISDPSLSEPESGTSELLFTVRRVGDDSGTVTLNWATANGTATAGSDYVAASGQVSFLPGGANTQTISIAINGDTVQEAAESFLISLAVASGNAVLADEAGQGTILVPPTKFFVVNDATTDRTYEYASGGTATENYALASGNTAPRGAASTAAGDKVWVVDANRNVYVYNPQGGLLGSWTPGGLASNAQVEGIATNGTDIWIVDARNDRVYRYANAAGRLTGSQGAASSFALNTGNKDAKDLVTDGTNIWVVNDSTTNKVFKYTVAGALVGSWTIASPNATPTGITLDPAGGTDLWIVDSGTDKVYQYVGGRAWTSGTRSASATFNLAAGNTNPQGIADPPTPGEAVLAGPDEVSQQAGSAKEVRAASAAVVPTVRQVLDRTVFVEQLAAAQGKLPAARPRGEPAASTAANTAEVRAEHLVARRAEQVTLANGSSGGNRIAAYDAVFGRPNDFLLDSLLTNLAVL